MGKIDVTDRLVFLAKTFDVFDLKNMAKSKLDELKAEGYNSKTIVAPTLSGDESAILAILSLKVNDRERILKVVSVSERVFSDIIAADPTDNKMYIQWMLTVFTRLIKTGDEKNIEAAIRFVTEDLPQANNYLTLFEGNKRKRKFTELCKGSFILKGVEDPTNINQYKSLSQLFDAVDPFIEKNPSEVEKLLTRFVESGKALIPVKDRKFTLYIPKTTDASIVFDKFANWCTAKANNTMFKMYTGDHKKPNGKNSDIYIIINNKFFTGESDEVFQIHFETEQIKDRHNGQNVSIFEKVIAESEGMSNFFYEELMVMAKQNKKGLEDNTYLEFLIKFGFSESLFEFLNVNTPTIKFMTREIPKLPDLSRFKSLDQLIITDAKLVELHPSIGKLDKLEMLVLTNNRIKTLPKEIGSLKKLEFINLNGNPLKEVPSEIAYLDKSNGGSLFKIAIKREEVGEKIYQRLKELLPSTQI